MNDSEKKQACKMLAVTIFISSCSSALSFSLARAIEVSSGIDCPGFFSIGSAITGALMPASCSGFFYMRDFCCGNEYEEVSIDTEQTFSI